MDDANMYRRQLSQDEIAKGKHRDFVGGLWDQVGLLQFEFLKRQGLLSQHKFLDVGCGSLRGGLHFIPYLEAGNYYGLDINASLIQAGQLELASAHLLDKRPHLLVNDTFQFSEFGAKFDFALALSVFTHLDANHIRRCLVEVRKVLQPQGRFYATFFQAPDSVHLSPIVHPPAGITTHYGSDPYHYSLAELQSLAQSTGLTGEPVGDWEHPRGQKMICFTLAPPAGAGGTKVPGA